MANPVYEMAISVCSYVPLSSGHERCQEGDIVVLRPLTGCIGLKERSAFLWICVSGISDVLAEEIHSSIIDPVTSQVYDKRRYCIPFARLKAVLPQLNLQRVRDHQDSYQPCVTVDEDTGEFLGAASPVPVQGLIFDRQTMRYL